MPVTIKQGALKYKDPTSGEYKSIDVVGDATTAEMVAAITAKGEEVLDSLPDDWTDLNQEVDDLKKEVGKVWFAKEISDFTDTILYKTDGTTTTLSQRFSTPFIECSNIIYVVHQGSILPQLARIAFFDSNYTFLSTSIPSGETPAAEIIIPVPNNARYCRAIAQSGLSSSQYFYGITKDSVIDNITNLQKKTETEFYEYFDLTPHFIYPVMYKTDGTTTTLSQRFSSEFIRCDSFDYINYSVSALQNYKSPVFFNANLEYISGVDMAVNGVQSGIAKVPEGAVYVRGAALQSAISSLYLHGVKERSFNERVQNLETVTGREQESVTSVVTPDMTVAEFRTAFNDKIINDYASLTKSATQSFLIPNIAMVTWESIYKRINIIFREKVYMPGLTHSEICNRVNVAFTHDIWMWKDAKYNDGTPRDFSISFTERSGEPSAIVSPDGGTLYVYGFGKRWKTNDGQKWVNEELTFLGVPSGSIYSPEHYNVNYIDGIYYLLGPLNDSDRELAMFTSEDGVIFTYRGIALNKDSITLSGKNVRLWGNSYIVKDGSTYFLYIEAKMEDNINFWDIFLCTGTNPLLDNGDETIGDWQYTGTGEIVGDLITSADLRARGNPDFAKGPDNRPVRIDGKWYMYYHVTHNGVMFIYRANSTDLRSWTVEGCIINNRDVPTAGESSAGNADHAIIEFKGKTYLFYTWDINSANVPYIKYVIDNRPIREILKMYP